MPVTMLLALSLPCLLSPQGPGVTPVDFDRDIRPLLAERCFACHGPDRASRRAGLRLDVREAAVADRGGRAAVVAGDVGASLLWQRITSEDPDERMPPGSAHARPLAPDELDRIKQWIEAGAPWAKHWAFSRPRRPELPPGDRHPIDALLGRTLEASGLTMSPRAQTQMLARRLSWDLTGLPPSLEQLAALGDDPSEPAWHGFTEQLLASPAHAERMAMWWLDAARYADTDGFQQDATRSNWPWRDWVVQAFAQNMPFDRFTELQFAGDLLEPEDPEAVLATCMHRNHMHNGEGGRDPEESRVDYVRDRTNTVGSVWLGLTLECAQCHDHKFDPISQADYYSLSAFFDSIDETGQAGGGAKPFLVYRSPLATETVELSTAELEAAESHSEELRVRLLQRFEEYLRRRYDALAGTRAERARGAGWQLPIVESATSSEGCALASPDPGHFARSGPPRKQDEYRMRLVAEGLECITGLELVVLPDPSGRFSDAEDGEFVLTGVKVSARSRDQRDVRHGRWRGVVATASGEGVDKEVGSVRGAIDDDPRKGWTTRGVELGESPRAVFALEEPLALGSDDVVEVVLLFRSSVEGAYARAGRLRLCGERGDAASRLEPTPQSQLAEAVAVGASAERLPDALRARLLEQFLDEQPSWRQATHRLRRCRAQLDSARKAAGELQVTVLRERAERRTTRVLERGLWDQHGEPVVPRTPARLFSVEPARANADRRDLARWLVHGNNPLTARVIANQLWQLLFGRGLVRTPGDFGIQGERPVHGDVLDWLSVELVECGWDLRHVLREIVASEAYRQSSRCSQALRERDPENRWLARGPRFRLPSWMIRDGALARSGLLDRRLGGPSVFPHQPEGVWEEMFMGRMRYQPTVGRGRHRRSLYAFWRRNVTPTFFFDSADRRTCSVTRRITNTPLQALTVFNDRTFVEAALALAWDVYRGAPSEGGDRQARLDRLFRRVLLRPATDAERRSLRSTYERALRIYRGDPEAAAAAIAPSPLEVSPVVAEETVDGAKLAAYAAVATVLLNLDEVLTRE
ncbi:MAG: PSD1 and planctomycete cytochrome C domain-containing protein [Planctomycetota bacterium]